jgi:DNA-binding transcriptional ArsR family regulator
MVTPQTGQPPAAETAEARIAKALAHPLRASILQRLGERVASPHDLALELGAPLGVVSYHVRMLRDYDCVELVRTEPRRGAVAHFYRAAMRPWFSDEQWATIPLSARRAIFGRQLDRIAADVATAARSKGFDHPQAHVSYTLLDLDQSGVDAVAAILEDALERIVAVNAECAVRRRAAGADAPRLRAELAMLLFEPAPGEPDG